MIEIVEFIYGLEHAETDQPVLGLHQRAGDLEIFSGVGRVALVGPGPVTYDTWTNHVSEKLEFVSVPDKNNRARAAPAVNFSDHFVFVCGNFQFVLHHTGRPKKPNHICAALDAKSSDDRRRSLTEVAGGTCHFPFLAKRTGKYINLRSNRGFVIVLAFEANAHPVIAIPAVV